MKKVGFIDLFINEWHADNYPKWIEEVSKKLGYDYKVCYCYAPVDVSPVNGKTTNEWCATQNAEKCASIKELCEKCDNIAILAPSNPEVHLELAKETFKYASGKNIYIDKTFAPDLNTAKEIYNLAKEYNVNIFSTSALRYASELYDFENEKEIVSIGGGGLFEEYCIHQVEIIVRVMGVGAQKVKVESAYTDGFIADIVYSDGRKAQLNYDRSSDFYVTVTTKNGTTEKRHLASDYFKNLLEKIVIFFETGKTDFDKEQTLEVMKIREGAVKGSTNLDVWLDL